MQLKKKYPSSIQENFSKNSFVTTIVIETHLYHGSGRTQTEI